MADTFHIEAPPMPHAATIATTLVYVLLVALTLVAAYIDLKSAKIPNILTFPAMAAFLALRALSGGLDGLSDSALGLAAGLTVFLAPYLLGVLGAGDVKLLAAVGAALGVTAILTLFLFTSLAGGLLFLGYGLLTNLRRASGAPLPRLRYGPAIAIGAIGAMAYHLAGFDYISFSFLG